MRRAACLALAPLILLLTACPTPLSKWEGWRRANVRYQEQVDCPLGGLGFFNPVTDTVCLDVDQINHTINVSNQVGKPHIAIRVRQYIEHHEAAHELDFRLGQLIATYECYPYGAGRCPSAVQWRAWERGAECILQLVRPDLDVVRAFWFVNDGYWKCPQNWLDFYRPRLRYAGVL